MPNVSVIIPTYNSAKFLPETIESVLGQTYQDFELIIIDDGSTDHTKEVIASYLKDHPQKIKYFYQKNSGVSAARNHGMQAAKGSFIAIIDSDDLWFPGRLMEGMKMMDAHPNVGLVHSNVINITEEGKPFNIISRNKKFLSGYISDYIFLRKADILCPTVLFRKECCDRLGGFDHNLATLGCEDRELWIRIAKQYEIAFIDKPLAYYRVRSDSMSHNIPKMLQARLYVVDKYCPADGPNRNLRNLALSKIYKDLGDQFLIASDFNQAKHFYLKALSFNLFNIWPGINFLKAFFRMRVAQAY